jgi:hypothetical protein
MFRLQALMPIAMGPKYDKYRNDEAGTMHIALLSAIAYAPCSPRMTPKVLRASLDKAFREILPQVEALDTKGAGGDRAGRPAHRAPRHALGLPAV